MLHEIAGVEQIFGQRAAAQVAAQLAHVAVRIAHEHLVAQAQRRFAARAEHVVLALVRAVAHDAVRPGQPFAAQRAFGRERLDVVGVRRFVVRGEDRRDGHVGIARALRSGG